MRQNEAHTTITRSTMMMCPCCQRIDEVTITVDAPGNNRAGNTAVKLYCPNCSLGNDIQQAVNMYEVDPLLAKGLAFLNAAGLVTVSHCSIVHNGVTDDSDDNPFVVINATSPEIITCIKECVANFVPADPSFSNCASIMTMEDRISKHRDRYSEAALRRARYRFLIQMKAPDRSISALTSASDELNRLCEIIARKIYLLPEDPVAYKHLRYSGHPNFTNHS